MRGLLRADKELDDRVFHDSFLREQLNHAFPSQWSFMLGEIALYSLIILIMTGTYLTFFFDPSDIDTIYRGHYLPLDHVKMSSAYASTVKIAFDVRGGLLIRQIHHWAAHLFLASIIIHMSRIFFTGAFRKPREINWMIGVTLLFIAILEGFCGYSLPDDLISGTGLRVADSVILSIPIIGTWLAFLVFGGPYPGTEIIKRLYIAHVLIIPALIVALVAIHVSLVVRQKHTDFPQTSSTEKQVAGERMFPHYAMKSIGFFCFVAAGLTGLGALVQINPIWLWGQYEPSTVNEYVHPDWYFMFVIGGLRLFPPWEIRGAGHDVPPLFWPGVVMPVCMYLLAISFPFLYRRATGDHRKHNILQRPRDAPVKTGIGAGALTFWIILTIAGGEDVFADTFDVRIEFVVWTNRAFVWFLPLLVFFVTYRICVALQLRDRRMLDTGKETGLGVLTPEGDYAEVTEPVTPDKSVSQQARESART